MSIRSTPSAQLSDYRGVLGWNAFTTGQSVSIPAIEVELFIKEHPVVGRKPKITEINTLSMPDPVMGYETNTQALFFGASDILQLQLSGWIITPLTAVTSSGNVIGYSYDLRDKAGNPLSWGNISYAEVVSAYISGRIDLSATGRPRRRDPDYYISPMGHQYSSPTIMVWSPTYAPQMQKQAFNMTLALEK